MNNKTIIFRIVFYLIIGGTTLYITTFLTGLNLLEAVADFESMMVAFSFPFLIWLNVKITNPNILLPFMQYIFLPLLIVWAYFSYQYLVHFSFPPEDISGDIVRSWNWLMDNKAYTLFLVIFVVGKRFLKRSSARFGRQFGKSLNSSVKEIFNGKNQ